MATKFERLASWLERSCLGLAIVAGVVVLIMTLDISYSIFTRYVLRAPSDILTESSRYMLLVTVFFATAYTLWTEGHVKVELLLIRLSVKVRNLLNLITHSLALVWIAVLTWQTGRMAWMAYKLSWHSDSISHVYLFPIYIWMPIGSLLLFLSCCYKVYGFWKGCKEQANLSSTKGG
ncbi:MAG: hypothetical protein COX14_00765 [Chloroflexi bacterium CG23_combo_of_CG06-09_8_20_14_all_45_10]|nr:MAG: hypothetical protein COX14_00765 [Chloroflexi bacterium CG23_combo_of_CG06-09_8_20_14_all_45_10]